MDGEDDGSVISLDKVDETLDNVECVEGIETAGGFVEEENAGTSDKFTGNTDSALLTTGDAATVAFFGADKLVANMVDAELSFDILDLLQLGGVAHFLG